MNFLQNKDTTIFKTLHFDKLEKSDLRYPSEISFFYKDIGMFGSYPSRQKIKRLYSLGVRIMIDLTMPDDLILERYSSRNCKVYFNIDCFSFPIKDKSIPENSALFCKFILWIISLLNSGQKLYIHCRGGHGRSGLVVTCILCKMFNLHPRIAFQIMRDSHDQRINLREKWKYVHPMNGDQKNFVYNLFRTTELMYDIVEEIRKKITQLDIEILSLEENLEGHSYLNIKNYISEYFKDPLLKNYLIKTQFSRFRYDVMPKINRYIISVIYKLRDEYLS